MRKLLVLTLAALSACSSEDRTAGGTTANEARALEDAAEMLQDQRLPAEAIPKGQPQPAASPATPQPGAKPTG